MHNIDIIKFQLVSPTRRALREMEILVFKVDSTVGARTQQDTNSPDIIEQKANGAVMKFGINSLIRQ